jgi:hypothetical protein
MKKILMFLVVAIALVGFSSLAIADQPFGSDKSITPSTGVDVISSGDKGVDTNNHVLKGVLISTTGDTGDSCTLWMGADTLDPNAVQLTPTIYLTDNAPIYIPLNIDISGSGGCVYVDVTDNDVDVALYSI